MKINGKKFWETGLNIPEYTHKTGHHPFMPAGELNNIGTFGRNNTARDKSYHKITLCF